MSLEARQFKQVADCAKPGSFSAKPKVVLVTNIPAPYRVPTWNLIATSGAFDLTLIFCAGKEPNREWDMDAFQFKSVFLKEAYFTKNGRYIHSNRDVIRHLRTLKPDVVVTTSFNPTFIYAFLYTRWAGRKHICMTDGTLESESKLSLLHKILRSVMFRGSAAFVGASEGSLAMYRAWRLPLNRIFKAPLCVDNARFESVHRAKEFDLMFCGRFADEKQPLFVFEVAERAAARLGRNVSVLFVGSGELEPAMRARAANAKGVVVHFHGFARQAELPDLYGRARVFLFPTRGDVWGIVASEACAAGLPILSTPFAGAVGEIIRDGVNGFVLDFNSDRWAECVNSLLSDDQLYRTFSNNSRRVIADHTHAVAANGLTSAIREALRGSK